MFPDSRMNSGVAAPVDRQQRTARVDRLALAQNLAGVVEQRDDAGVLPEVDRIQAAEIDQDWRPSPDSGR